MVAAEMIELRVAVREGDFSVTKHGFFGARIELAPLDRAYGGDLDRWRQVDAKAFAVSLEVSPTTLIGTVKEMALLAAGERGTAFRPDGNWKDFGLATTTWLADPATDEGLDESATVEDLALRPGDAVVLCVEHPPQGMYMLGPARDPADIFAALQLGMRSKPPREEPRLWGVLLYTDEDHEIATYVRTNFDELNALSGPPLRILVLERPQDWKAARRYWHGILEPELYRTFSALRWTGWKPFERHRAYDIARTLGIDPVQFPCLVLVSSIDTDNRSRVVFPIGSPPVRSLRRLFGEIQRVIGIQSQRVTIAEFEEQRFHEWSGYGGDGRKQRWHGNGWRDWLVEADRKLYDTVVDAEQRIIRSLREGNERSTSYDFHGHTAILSPGEPMTQSFNFFGQTTFINQPVDTVIRDFQNAYGSMPGHRDLERLLELVLASRDLADEDKEETTRQIHELARELDSPEPREEQARSRLDKLKERLTQAADIAQPATEIIASITTLLSS